MREFNCLLHELTLLCRSKPCHVESYCLKPQNRLCDTRLSDIMDIVFNCKERLFILQLLCMHMILECTNVIALTPVRRYHRLQPVDFKN